ncbi:MAG: hypothetical protein IKC49_01650 [Clostridia bacterium]|nr:hypothetical protein [Clostridia bacterium]
MFWQNYKGYILGAFLGILSIVIAVPMIFTHTLEGVFLGGWCGTALGYLGVIYAMDQYNHNKNFKRNIIKFDEDLLEEKECVDVDEINQECTITNNNHHSKNYIERLTDKKAQEKIENRPRSVDACIINTDENHEESIEL